MGATPTTPTLAIASPLLIVGTALTYSTTPASFARASKIGYVTDYVGKLLFEPRAKESGVVLYVRAVPTINKGEPIASIGVVGVAPK